MHSWDIFVASNVLMTVFTYLNHISDIIAIRDLLQNMIDYNFILPQKLKQLLLIELHFSWVIELDFNLL